MRLIREHSNNPSGRRRRQQPGCRRPRVEVLGSIVLLLGISACATDGLLDDNRGSTLPVPDMSQVSYTYDEGLSNDAVILSGDAGALPVDAGLGVRAENLRTGTVDDALVGPAGSFVLPLSDAQLGDRVALWSFLGEDASARAELDLHLDGTPPAAPVEVDAQLVNGGAATVHGVFSNEDAPLRVRLLNLDSGAVIEGETVQQTTSRVFELDIDAALGDTIAANGIYVAAPLAPGPFATATVVLPP